MTKYLTFCAALLMGLLTLGCESAQDEPTTETVEPTTGSDNDEVLTQPGFEPAEPELPTFANWEMVTDCPLGTMPLLGQTGCHPVGRACPEGDWPEELPNDVPLLYVQPGGTGDGLSPENPMGSIQQALEAALPQSWVILSKGEYTEPVVSNRDVNIRGACATETLINPIFTDDEQALLDSLSLELTEDFVAGVRIEGEGDRRFEDIGFQSNAIGISIVDVVGTVTLQGIWVHDAVLLGIGVAGSQVDIDSIAVTGVRPTQAGTAGAGMYSVLGSTINVASSYFYQNCFIGFGMKDQGTQVSATDLIVHASSPYPDDHPEFAGSYGWGIQVFDGSSFTGERILSQDNQGAGFVLSGAAPLAEATIDDVVVRGTTSDVNFRNIYTWSGVEMGFGLEVWGGRMNMSRVLLENNQTAGMLATETPLPCSLAGLNCDETFVDATDLTIRGTLPDSRGYYGIGMAVFDGAEVNVERILVEDNSYFGIGAWDGFRAPAETTTAINMKDLQILNTMDSEGNEGTFGDGLIVAYGASAVLENFIIQNNARVGLLVGGKSSSIEATGDFNIGALSGNIIGVNMQTAELNFDANFTDVLVYDNEVDINQDEVEIPSFSLLDY